MDPTSDMLSCAPSTASLQPHPTQKHVSDTDSMQEQQLIFTYVETSTLGHIQDVLLATALLILLAQRTST